MTIMPQPSSSAKSPEPELPPFPIPRWALLLIAFVLLAPPLYIGSFAPVGNMLQIEITGHSRIKRVEISSTPIANAEHFLFIYGPVIGVVNEVPIFYPYFISWARMWNVTVLEYQ